MKRIAIVLRKAKQIIRLKHGQSILGFVFAFIVLLTMAIGITRVWTWFNINYAQRQAGYQLSRASAGGPDVYGSTAIQYLTAPHVDSYKPFDLTEDWLFKGQPTGMEITYKTPDLEGIVDANLFCFDKCKEDSECYKKIPATEPGGEDTYELINHDCKCLTQCMCDMSIEPKLIMYDAQIEAFKSTACQMRSEAADLESAAADCDDPWEIGWWGGFGIVAGKLTGSRAT